MKAILFFLLLFLTGCASKLPQPSVSIPANLMQKCQPLQKLAGITGADMLSNIVSNAEIYHKCSDMHSKLIEAVSKETPSK